MKVLFIGNSHTFVHYVPARTAEFCKSYGQPIEPVMLTHPVGPDWHLRQSQTYFNLLWGGYDAVILQHNAHPFPGKESLLEAGEQMAAITPEGTKIYLYMTWSEKSNPAGQAAMSAAYEALAEKIDATICPVGRIWWQTAAAHPDEELYFCRWRTQLCAGRVPGQQRLSGARCWAWRSRRRVVMQMPRAWKGCGLIPE